MKIGRLGLQSTGFREILANLKSFCRGNLRAKRQNQSYRYHSEPESQNVQDIHRDTFNPSNGNTPGIEKSIVSTPAAGEGNFIQISFLPSLSILNLNAELEL